MDRFLDSPPVAYESSMPSQARHTIQLGDPIGPSETPEQAMARAEVVCRQALDGELGEDYQALVRHEAQLYGLDLAPATIPEFIEARRAKIEACDQMLAESFEHRAPVMLGRLAEDVANPDEDPQQIRATLGQRLEEVWVGVEDPLVVMDGRPLTHTGLAQYDAPSRGIMLNYAAVVAQATREDSPLALSRELFDYIAEHESFHAMAAAWYDPEKEPQDEALASSGLNTGEHGWWLDEGNIEKYREDAFGENNFGYEIPVLALVVADAADPEFAHARLRAALLNKDHGAMIGRLELLFGPGAPDSLDETIEKAWVGDIAIGDYKATLMKLLPEDKRPAGGRGFDRWMQKLDHRHDLQVPTID